MCRLRWQVFSDNTGYDYKNSIANAVFMQLAARLSRYTGNTTYGDWADKVFTWLEGTNLINNTSWMIADGAHVESNCTDINHAYFSYNPAAAIYTAAVMYNITTQSIWEERMMGIINSSTQHFSRHSRTRPMSCLKHNARHPMLATPTNSPSKDTSQGGLGSPLSSCRNSRLKFSHC
jgi:mannan endo-1,6-alpha-mannosidase